MYQRLCIYIVLLFVAACGSKNEGERVHSAYYWTTTFKMSEQKSDFIRKNNIRRLYVRFFDVVMSDDVAKPNATIEFVDSVPADLQIVPTVFVMNDCMALRQDSLPERIVSRLLKMCNTHDIKNVNEIQVDCDWTARTQDNYFRLLERMRELLNDHGKTLSVTIRLHQLSMLTPPADRGVLMVYNTGDVTDVNCRNPILDLKDVSPYLNAMQDYQLPLSAAYPIFSWDVLFRGNRFVGIQHYDGEWPTMAGDKIVNHRLTADEVVNVKRAVDKQRPDFNSEIILYDLSDKNLDDFSDTDIARIYE